MAEDGLRLECSDGRRPVYGADDINAALVALGSRLWPIDLEAAPDEIRRLLAQPWLSEAESQRLLEHFLLSRERMLEVISGAGRTPQVPGGGEMTTWVHPHDYSYPQLFLVEDGVDYRRFDRFHVNVARDGTGVDEVMQVLSGSGVDLHQRLPGGEVLTLYIERPGWLVTYSGELHHIGSISKSTLGTKVLMQVIGPARWVMKYEGEE